MSTTQQELILHCLNYLKEVQDRYSAASGSTELISHTGDLSESDLEAILNRIEKISKENDDPPAVIKRLFSVMVESLQNLRAHGERSVDGGMATCVVVGVTDEYYLVDTGNPINSKDVEAFRSKVEELNKLQRNDLRKLYLDVLSDGKRSDKGGAGLGMITISLRSKNQIEIQVAPVNGECSYLKLGFRIGRK